MPWRHLLSLAGLAAVTILLSQARSADGPETRLDNGKDLTGWTGNTEGWSVADGAIHLEAKKAKESLFFGKPHSDNCLIAIEFRATPNGDSGLYIHGKQFQIRDYPAVGPTPYAPHAKLAGEWNKLEFDFTDGFAVVRLNGKLIERAWRIGIDPMKGLGLQADKGDFDFRNIVVKDKAAPPKEPVTVKDGKEKKKKP